MFNQVLNTIGLVLNMVGVGLLFFFGPPQPMLEEGISLGVEGATIPPRLGSYIPRFPPHANRHMGVRDQWCRRTTR